MTTETAVRERPILFAPALVRAILAGEKTQTRRVVRPSAYQLRYTRDKWGGFDSPQQGNEAAGLAATILMGQGLDVCPYGKPGDHLWVRESWWQLGRVTRLQFAEGDDPGDYRWQPYYSPDHGRRADWLLGVSWDHNADEMLPPKNGDLGWRKRPSIHMPRWASRLTLEITEVRVQRTQDISEADAEAEGMRVIPIGRATWTARQSFSILWEQINGKRGYGWAANPWVWALTFRRVGQ